jgi:hypothetical protein
MKVTIAPEDKTKEVTSMVLDDGSRQPLRVAYRDGEMDFAVLESGKPLTPPNYSIGNAADFRVANTVILASNFQTGLNIRIGRVTQIDFVRYGSKGELAEKKDEIFGISTVVSEGDSGSPILFLRDGKLELGGITSFIVLPARGLGYGLKITPVIEKLKETREHDWILPLLEASDPP